RAPDQGLLVLLADPPLDSQELLLALRLHPLRQLPVESKRLGAFLARELEDAHLVEAHLLDELAELFEVRLRLAGKPDDEAGAEGQVRNALPDLAHQLADPGRVAPALHPPEHRIADVLQGPVEVAGEVRLPRQGLD